MKTLLTWTVLILAIAIFTTYSSILLNPPHYKLQAPSRAVRDINMSEFELLSSIINAECANCSQYEMELVGSVIINRANSEYWPQTITEVINEKNQFRGLNNNNFYRTEKSDSVAMNLLAGKHITPGLYYFCTKRSINYQIPANSIIESEYHYFKR